ncbi:MAG: ABC transporter ATP-binding protein [Chloroflexota bacterium]|nr:ABC transporter ATP-binding protein [Chloroflexota bacterium]
MTTAPLQTQALMIGYRAPLIHPLDLALESGKLVCLIGPNGAGKSTLLRTLAGMQRPLRGSVTITGIDVHRMSAAERSRHLSIVLTERVQPGLLTGYGLVSLGRHPHTDWSGQLSARDIDVVQAAVTSVGAEDYAARPLTELSDGQRQKLMIARALAQDAPVMLLDEPTAFLDLPRRVEMMALLRRLARETNRAILLSTHDLDLALRTADRVWLIADGQFQAGAPEDLVLSGAFEAAFRAHDVAFDSASGSFRLNIPGCVGVRLIGNGAVRAWTQHAIERAGYMMVDDAPLTITISTDASRTQWHVVDSDSSQACDSIEELIAALSNVDTSRMTM